jgi:Circularly permutated YpsA SLOG family
MANISKITSGAQTGADRAALDLAIEHGIPHGGRCPKGKLAEDGSLSTHLIVNTGAMSATTTSFWVACPGLFGYTVQSWRWASQWNRRSS